ncbi:hypothetical protein KC669_04890 [Candidatus Dojkabacteria bacterium]|uniref:Uncharacterized protein n=1 Tax=Candidatus Dojkabacteria bacterium TaxID=2099670 RepID=A0A955RMG9_9BACT|nr:hypothetical protein [Candidatus Dojkabacteria bacterium]
MTRAQKLLSKFFLIFTALLALFSLSDYIRYINYSEYTIDYVDLSYVLFLSPGRYLSFSSQYDSIENINVSTERPFEFVIEPDTKLTEHGVDFLIFNKTKVEEVNKNGIKRITTVHRNNGNTTKINIKASSDEYNNNSVYRVVFDYSDISGYELKDKKFIFKDKECEITIESKDDEYLFDKVDVTSSYFSIAQPFDKEIQFKLLAKVVCE